MSEQVVYVDLKYTPEPKARKLLGPKRSRWQPWRAVVLVAGNHEPLFVSSEAWINHSDAVDAIWRAFSAETTVFLRDDGGTVLIRRGVTAE